MLMSEIDVERRAAELHAGGYNCAESVLVAVLEALGQPVDGPVPRVATCFGGGVGRTEEELCGALAGGLMAIGCASGRSRQGDNWDRCAETAAELRRRFALACGSTRCGEILASFGPGNTSPRCHALSGRTAALAVDVLGR
jgi:C_GCAxxG_C_C family probable redox protein